MQMLGRRSHARVSIQPAADGFLSLPRDVSIHVGDDGQLMAVSRDAGVIGETARLGLPLDDVNMIVEIVDSKPFIRDGVVRHQLQLRPLSNVVSNETGRRR